MLKKHQEMSIMHVVGVRIFTVNSRCSTFGVWALLSLRGQHVSSDETIAPALVINRVHHRNRGRALNQWARCKPWKGLKSVCNFGAASVSETWRWHCLSSLCERGPCNSLLCSGAHPWWHYTESKHARAVVCGSGHFPRHRRLHKDHHTTLLFTVWPVDELWSVAQ